MAGTVFVGGRLSGAFVAVAVVAITWTCRRPAVLDGNEAAMDRSLVVKVVSGGQTGVDRAALDVGVALGLPQGGWCPLGGWAEDMPDPPGLLAHYPGLKETPSKDPAQRTRWNVRDSDWTLILVDRRGLASSQGTMLTLRLAQRYGKPNLIVDLDGPDAAAHVAAWLADAGQGLTLNVAGPRESTAPGIYSKARRVLMEAFQACS